MSPSVSVLVPAYNHEAFVDQAIESVLNQTFSDLELIALDDGSADGTLHRLRSWEQRDGRVTVLTHPGGVNRGLLATLGVLLDRAQGEAVAILASDDRWRPDRLAIQTPLLAAHRWLSGRCEVIDESGAKSGLLFGAPPARTSFAFIEQQLAGVTVATTTVLMRRDFVHACGGIGTAPLEDLEMWLKLGSVEPPGYSDAVVADYRLVGTSIWQQAMGSRSTVRLAHETVLAVLRWSGLDPASRTQLDEWASVYAVVSALQREELESALNVSADQRERLERLVIAVIEVLVGAGLDPTIRRWCACLVAQDRELEGLAQRVVERLDDLSRPEPRARGSALRRLIRGRR